MSEKTQKEMAKEILLDGKIELAPLSKVEELQEELQKQQRALVEEKRIKLGKFLEDENIKLVPQMILTEGKAPSATIFVMLKS